MFRQQRNKNRNHNPHPYTGTAQRNRNQHKKLVHLTMDKPVPLTSNKLPILPSGSYHRNKLNSRETALYHSLAINRPSHQPSYSHKPQSPIHLIAPNTIEKLKREHMSHSTIPRTLPPQVRHNPEKLNNTYGAALVSFGTCPNTPMRWTHKLLRHLLAKCLPGELRRLHKVLFLSLSTNIGPRALNA